MVIYRIIISASVFFAVCIPVRAEEPPIDRVSMEEFLSGKADIQKAHAVIDRIQAEINKNPSNYANYSALAFVCDYAGLYERAAGAIKSEIKYTPEKGEWDIVYGNLAREYLNLGMTEELRKPAIKSLRFDPKNISSHMHLLSYYVLKGDYVKAGSELKIMSDLDKEMDFYYEIYSRFFNKIQDKDSVIRLFKEAVNANPANPLSHRILATAIRDSSYDDMEKNMPLVMSSFNKALELNPVYIPTYISIANTYMYLGLKTNDKTYLENALNWANKAYKVDPKNSKLAYCTGNIFLAMEEYDKGIERLEYALYNGNDDKDSTKLLAAAYNNKAYSYYEIGKDIKEGLRLVDKAIALDPDNGLILSTKAELLYKMKRFNEAYDYIKRAARLEPDEPGIKNDMEIIEAALKKH